MNSEAEKLSYDVKKWVGHDGQRFFWDIGMHASYSVLDFGCGPGRYAIPLAKAIGDSGKVYAFDKDADALQRASALAQRMWTHNIEFIRGDTKIPLYDEIADAVLCYDAIHYAEQRNDVYSELKRVVKTGGLLSLYPMHNKNDSPLMGLADIEIEDVEAEVVAAGFVLEARMWKTLLHDDAFTDGFILNFRKWITMLTF